MKYHDSISYPLDVNKVMAYFTSPYFYLEKYRRQGARNVCLLAAEQEASVFSVTVSREVPVEAAVPVFLRGRIPQAITLVQTDRWDARSRTGSLDIEFKSLPVRLTCATSLRDTSAGALQALDFDIRISVPLIGGKLETLLANDLRLKTARDARAALELMAVATA